MPVWRFVAYTLGGSALWNALLVGLGWFLGERWTLVRQYGQVVQYVLLAALIGAVAWFVWRRWGRRR
ncbi:DedA family protein [Rubrobacter marinus]|uniref:DedA family protein n=1 Tax=Rubrobacter marinus TaxID=2653852 RepID=UPI001D19688F|nr:hypothetical protein [Rubrobacter marinus]